MSALRQAIMASSLVLGFAAAGFAQTSTPSARFSPQTVQDTGNTRPLAEPGIFDYDAQMFSPVEFTNYEERQPNVGFYLTIDRVYNNISRGSARSVQSQGVTEAAVPTGSDWQWGNRFEGGWMTEADTGWQAIYEYSSGSFFAAGGDELVANPMMVKTRFNQFKLNRTFRQQLSRGGYFEPYAGFRFLGISDNTIEDTSFLSPDGTGTIVSTGNRFRQRASNSAFGGHVGGRYNVNRGKFRYGAEGALATMYNRQRFWAIDVLRQGTSVATNEFFDNDDSFVPVLDARLELSYALTRDIGLRTGFQVLYMWDGIARSDNTSTFSNPNSALGIAGGQTGVFSESSTVAGFNFGVEWRR